MRVTGTLLPSGERTELWLLGDRVTFTRPHTESHTVAENLFLTPGLVDVHTHPGHDEAAVFTGERFAAECAQHVAAGTTALRVPGHTGPVPPALRTDPAMPRLVTAGRLLAHTGLATGHPMHAPTDDLLSAGLAEAAANDGWCKIIADWEHDEPPVPEPALRALVDAAHARGFRVAAHCQTAAGTRTAVECGVDSIEHGWYLTDDLIERLAARGGAFVPTATAFLQIVDDVRGKPEGPRKDYFLGGVDGLSRSAAVAHEAGVTVLAGTDSAPFGNVVSEVRFLLSAGLPPTVAIGAASWTARAYLGLPGLVEGGPADLVGYDVDPRREPGVLSHPRLIVLRGRIVTRR
ncbi:amidohydrolase family protein [Virgisporangium aurantiacum]|uniref:Amidohydrolase n=1 Tax=Virgisporangium aurantiacum TaxID=175570 RepID=A0A8J3ZLX9_9ACTN|nr:amidohydrolase family protein [Virgisporangium aurantiacum]GIJ63936.1 amidohydrolase [Virgisporangium aurantiacum]